MSYLDKLNKREINKLNSFFGYVDKILHVEKIYKFEYNKNMPKLRVTYIYKGKQQCSTVSARCGGRSREQQN